MTQPPTDWYGKAGSAALVSNIVTSVLNNESKFGRCQLEFQLMMRKQATTSTLIPTSAISWHHHLKRHHNIILAQQAFQTRLPHFSLLNGNGVSPEYRTYVVQRFTVGSDAAKLAVPANTVKNANLFIRRHHLTKQRQEDWAIITRQRDNVRVYHTNSVCVCSGEGVSWQVFCIVFTCTTWRTFTLSHQSERVLANPHALTGVYIKPHNADVFVLRG